MLCNMYEINIFMLRFSNADLKIRCSIANEFIATTPYPSRDSISRPISSDTNGPRRFGYNLRKAY
jgi:hypothetical protein